MSIYLDHNATSPPTLEHLSSLCEKIHFYSGNPSSPHSAGRAASVALSESRLAVAKTLNVDAGEIIFLSGGSEANNFALQGVLNNSVHPISSQQVILSAFEHSSVYEPLFFFERKCGLNLSTVQVSSDGFVEIIEVLKRITPQTTLLTIIAANNEIGTIQPVKKLGDFLHYKRWNILENPAYKEEFLKLESYLAENVTIETLKNIHFHVDAVQIYGKVRAKEWFSAGFDSCSISGHKLGALQGIGVLFLRRGRKLCPLIFGGPQEKNRRAGTENLPGIISLGLVAKSLQQESWWEAVTQMNERRKSLFLELKKISSIEMNSTFENVTPNTIHFSICENKIKGEDVLIKLDLNQICASSGSACSSSTNLPSKVVLALNKNIILAKNTVRLSLSLNTTDDEVSKVINCLQKIMQ